MVTVQMGARKSSPVETNTVSGWREIFPMIRDSGCHNDVGDLNLLCDHGHRRMYKAYDLS